MKQVGHSDHDDGGISSSLLPVLWEEETGFSVSIASLRQQQQ